MAKNYFHWKKEDYFPFLAQPYKKAIIALEYFVDDLHIDKDLTIDKFLSHCESKDILLAIINLMSSDNLRISGNSAYVFGTIAETNGGIQKITELLNNKDQSYSKNVLSYLIKLLKTSDYECLMNAAGTIGTISENINGRIWLIAQPLLEEIVELSIELLGNKNIWVSSNAALVLARISIEDKGCEKLLNFDSCPNILKKLIDSLEGDNPGRGMNCAFTIGRICDQEHGRIEIINLGSIKKLIKLLMKMVDNNLDIGCTKNACYALSCLASYEKTYQAIIDHENFSNFLNTIIKLLASETDTETQWFLAMLMRMFCSFPNGCIKMKAIPLLLQHLSDLYSQLAISFDVKEELAVILENLKPLEQPDPVIAEDDICVYQGTNNFYLVENLKPFTHYLFFVQAYCTEINEKSIASEPVRIQTDESIPSEPINIRVVGATSSFIKITWEQPNEINGLLKSYYIYKEDTLIHQTTEHYYLITGLNADTLYEFFVCASTSKGKGEKASIKAKTCSLGETLPEKPIFGLVGKREILVRWQPPQVITGRLNRYDLYMNEKCVYSGISLEYQVSMLKPDTEYKFEIVAITTEGKCKSKIAKTRTLKDEYDPERMPLYPGSINQNITNITIKEKKEKNETCERKKYVSKDIKPLLAIRKSKTIIKDVAYSNNPLNGFSDNSSSTVKPEMSFLPRVSNSSQSIQFQSFNSNQIIKDFITDHNNNNYNNNLSKMFMLKKSKTQFNLRGKEQYNLNESSSGDKTKYATLNIKEITPNFPALPIVTQSKLYLNSSCLNRTNNNQTNLSNNPNLSALNFNNTDSYVKEGNNSELSYKLINSSKNSIISIIDTDIEVNKPVDSNITETNYSFLFSKFKKKKKIENSESFNFLRSNTFVAVNQRDCLDKTQKFTNK